MHSVNSSAMSMSGNFAAYRFCISGMRCVIAFTRRAQYFSDRSYIASVSRYPSCCSFFAIWIFLRNISFTLSRSGFDARRFFLFAIFIACLCPCRFSLEPVITHIYTVYLTPERLAIVSYVRSAHSQSPPASDTSRILPYFQKAENRGACPRFSHFIFHNISCRSKSLMLQACARGR